MRSIRLFIALCLGVTAIMLASVVAPVRADAGPKAKVLLEGLNSPKGLAHDGFGALVLGQGAFGPPDPVLVYPILGRDRGAAIPVSDPIGLVDVAISPFDGTGWGISFNEEEHGVLLHELADGSIVTVLDITEYQAGDLDPHDLEGIPEESNPYGLAVLPNGDALVADAAGNDLIRVTPEGDAWTVATFANELVATDHLPFPFPDPVIPSEAVPTTVTLGPGGDVYVGQLQGFPFRPGTSEIWRIDPDAEGALCTASGGSGGCSLHASGFTSIHDIAFGNGGRMYVYELAADGALAFEAGFEPGGVFPPAVLLEVKKNKRTELAAGQLSQPGGVVELKGKVYVTDGMFTGGRLLRVVG
jgi:hypothetical protein